MKKLILIVWLTLCASPAFATQHVELTDSEKIATEFVEQLVQGEYQLQCLPRTCEDPGSNCNQKPGISNLNQKPR